MIHNVITAISSRLNIYIKNRLFVDDDIVVVRNLVDLKGGISDGIQNKITVFLLSIEEDKTSKNKSLSRVNNNPVIILNINIMFASYFTNTSYVESLRYISLVIEFFQKYPIAFQNPFAIYPDLISNYSFKSFNFLFTQSRIAVPPHKFQETKPLSRQGVSL